MIATMVNRNDAPRLVKRRVGAVPVFQEDFDWDEQARVERAWHDVAAEESPELWEELVRHISDEQYGLTVARDGEFEFGLNYTVGDLCKVIAYERLVGPAMRHRCFDAHGRPVRWDFERYLWRTLGDWRKERATKGFAELQLDVFELALDGSKELSGIRDDKRAATRSRLTDDRDGIRASGKPLFHRLSLDSYDVYSAETAARIRRVLSAEK